MDNPQIDDLVCFIDDKTLCVVLGSIPSRPPIFGLDHPSLGHILVRRHMFVFPIGSAISIAEPPRLVLCRDCRWMKRIRHPAARGMEDAPSIATCWNPTFIVNGEKDHVLGEAIPADPYEHNKDGHCHGFERPPGTLASKENK